MTSRSIWDASASGDSRRSRVGAPPVMAFTVLTRRSGRCASASITSRGVKAL